MKKFYFIIFLFLFSVNVSAVCPPYLYTVRDINTKTAIYNATFDMGNLTEQTNLYGQILDNNQRTFENYTISQTGYFTLEGTLTTTNDTCEYQFYVYPVSTVGLIKVMWTDDTIAYSERKLCVFYKDNGRLMDCYSKNETIWLLNNYEYYFEPTTNFWDMLSNIRSIWDNKFVLIPYIGLTAFLFYMIFKLIKGK